MFEFENGDKLMCMALTIFNIQLLDFLKQNFFKSCLG